MSEIVHILSNLFLFFEKLLQFNNSVNDLIIPLALMLLMGIICFEKSSCSNIVFFSCNQVHFFPWRNKVNFRHFLTYIWCVLSAYCQAGSKLSRSSPYRPLTYTQFLPPFCIDYNRRICTKKNHPQVIGLLFTYTQTLI